MPGKAYLEITNACNLSCHFCHGTKRPIRFMSREDFTCAAEKLRPFAQYLFFHLMGEPLLHPELASFLAIAGEMSFRVILTTNGTLLGEKQEILLSAPALHKVSVSLHAYEANAMAMGLEQYLDDCFAFCRLAARRGIIAVMRLWNRGGAESLNEEILSRMEGYFGAKSTWKETYSGYKIAERVFLEWGERFDWPDEDGAFVGQNHGCWGLRDQVGVLCDGTVVPCCLDAEGAIGLGNLFSQSLEEILSSPRAVALKKSLRERRVNEALCCRCGYAHKKNY